MEFRIENNEDATIIAVGTPDVPDVRRLILHLDLSISIVGRNDDRNRSISYSSYNSGEQGKVSFKSPVAYITSDWRSQANAEKKGERN